MKEEGGGGLNMAFCIHKGMVAWFACMHGVVGPGARCAVYSYTDKWERVLSNKTFLFLFLDE